MGITYSCATISLQPLLHIQEGMFKEGILCFFLATR